MESSSSWIKKLLLINDMAKIVHFQHLYSCISTIELQAVFQKMIVQELSLKYTLEYCRFIIKTVFNQCLKQ